MPPKKAANKPEVDDSRRRFPGRNFQEKPSSVIKEFPVLRYGADNNYIDFMEKCANYAGQRFGDLGRIFDDLDQDYWEPDEIPEPEPEAFSEVNDPPGWKRKVYTSMQQDRQKILIK